MWLCSREFGCYVGVSDVDDGGGGCDGDAVSDGDSDDVDDANVLATAGW